MTVINPIPNGDYQEGLGHFWTRFLKTLLETFVCLAKHRYCTMHGAKTLPRIRTEYCEWGALNSTLNGIIKDNLVSPSSPFGSDRVGRTRLVGFADNSTVREFTVQSSSCSTLSVPNHDFKSRRNSDMICIRGRSEFVQVKMIYC